MARDDERRSGRPDYERREEERAAWGCAILLIFLAISPIIWLIALISRSELEETFRWPAGIGIVVVTLLGLVVWRMGREPGQPRLWKKVSLPAGVRREQERVSRFWEGAPRPDVVMNGRQLIRSHRVEVGGRSVYGFVALDTDSGDEDWFELCSLRYALPDLDLTGARTPEGVMLDAGPGSVGASFVADMDSPQLRGALAGTDMKMQIRGRCLFVRRGKARPVRYIAHLMEDAPRIAAVADAIGHDVYLRWSPEARTALGGGEPEWEMWNPEARGIVQDPE